ncbi:hypothetical protein L3Y34_000516 [Caenorhabditis briggsae]|uniref:Uncharacterized protein n=1 Tax=Caenorhabditis briggsae TaxID=6238 RepID=A0AAE9INR5_CAEBR|nr:hypothetical protein L3Y34_000516 [Caenorhabditis briggsae]
MVMEAMMWNDAKRCHLENAEYDKLRLSSLTRSLARCQNEMENEPIPIAAYLDQEAKDLTNNPMCGSKTCSRKTLFNLFCVNLPVPTQPLVIPGSAVPLECSLRKLLLQERLSLVQHLHLNRVHQSRLNMLQERSSLVHYLHITQLIVCIDCYKEQRLN